MFRHSGAIILSVSILLALSFGNGAIAQLEFRESSKVRSASDPVAASDDAGEAGSTNSVPSLQPTSRTITQVSSGGVLPRQHNQKWREYDIRPYTTRVTTTERPEQAVIDWILRETGTEVWFSEPFGILNASKDTLRVYHTEEMHDVVRGVVDRLVSSQAESHAFIYQGPILEFMGVPSLLFQITEVLL